MIKGTKDTYIAEHLLLAILESASPASRLLEEFGLRRETVLRILAGLRGSMRITDEMPESKFDLVIALDHGRKNRLGLGGYFNKHPETPILVFDHHIVNGQGGNFWVIYPDYSATSEIIYDYFKSIGFKIDKKIASQPPYQRRVDVDRPASE